MKLKKRISTDQISADPTFPRYPRAIQNSFYILT